MPSPTPLPPDLAALARVDAGPLQAVTVRLDAGAIAEVDALAQRLNRADRGPLLRFVVREGLRAVRAQLEATA